LENATEILAGKCGRVDILNIILRWGKDQSTEN